MWLHTTSRSFSGHKVCGSVCVEGGTWYLVEEFYSYDWRCGGRKPGRWEGGSWSVVCRCYRIIHSVRANAHANPAIVSLRPSAVA